MAGPPPPPMPQAPAPQANRTDLLTPGPAAGPPPGGGQPNGQPIQVPTGGPYGEAQQLQQAQQAVPLPQQAGPPQAPSGGPVDIGAAMNAARNFQKPAMGKLTRGTERPNEPVTAGLPGTPAATPPPRQVGSLSTMINNVASISGSSVLSQLASRAAALGQ